MNVHFSWLSIKSRLDGQHFSYDFCLGMEMAAIFHFRLSRKQGKGFLKNSMYGFKKRFDKNQEDLFILCLKGDIT